MQTENPYQAPTSDVVTSSTTAIGTLIPGGQAVPMGNFTSWIGTGWKLFTEAPLPWALITLVYLAIMIVLGYLPYIAFILTTVLGVIFTGGIMLGCREHEGGRTLEVGDMFAGFKEKTAQLVILGVLNLVALFVLVFVLGVLAALFGGAGLMSLMSGGADSMAALGAALGVGLLLLIPLAFIAGFFYLIAFWFATPLVVLHDVDAIAAIGMSLKGAMKNIVAIFICSVIFAILFVLGALPVLLGWLVVFPLMCAATYAAYKDIYVDPATA